MPLLAAFIGGLITKLVDLLVNLFTKKFLIAAALVLAMGLVYTVIVTALNLALSSLNINAVPLTLLYGISMLPSNTVTCITIILAVKTAVIIYNYQMKIIMIRASS